MLKIFKNKKAQNTAEYAILIALVVGGVIAMQTYAQRALQGRLRDGSKALQIRTSDMDGLNGSSTLQYEPYYSTSNTTTDRDTTKTTSETGVSENGTSNRSGNESTTWNSEETF